MLLCTLREKNKILFDFVVIMIYYLKAVFVILSVNNTMANKNRRGIYETI